MKTFLILLLSIFLAACNIVEIDEVEETAPVDSALITGKCCILGKLHKTTIYYGSNKNCPSAVTEIFYDEQERPVEYLNVADAPPIVGARLTRKEYDQSGLQIWERNYIIENKEAVPTTFREYINDDKGRLFNTRTHYPPQGTVSQGAFRHYDEEDKLVVIGGIDPSEGERTVYEYEGGKVKYRLWMLGGDDIFAGYLYLYNDKEQLVAEEFFRGERISEGGEGEGIYKEYDYDQQGRVSEEREYDPYWGFPMRYFITYTYWDGEVKAY